MSEDLMLEQSVKIKVRRLDNEVKLNSFAQDVLAGLTASPKTLQPKYFYDELGSHLFEAICCLPEYYVKRDEDEILQNYTDEIIASINTTGLNSIRLIELGSGSSEKTRYLIDFLLKHEFPVQYIPIDISESSLRTSSKELLRLYPQLRVIAYAADFFTALKTLSATSRDESWNKERNIFLFLGSTIGNLSPHEANELLRGIRNAIYPGDALLIGADLRKSLDVLIPAYNDALGVTAAFNLNLLVRINRELSGNFDITKFEHRAIYNEESSRIEMHLYSRISQAVKIKALDLEVSFEGGESIHTENSYKFDITELSKLADKTGFGLKKSWTDDNRRFSLNLFTAI